MSYICAELSIQCDFPNSVAYIAFWIDRLRSDRKEVFRAAADAQRIADYLLAFHPAYAERGQSRPSDNEVAQEPEASGTPAEAALQEAA